MGEGYKAKAVSGVTWTFAQTIATYFVTFGIGVTMARLLSPSDYGTLGMIGIFTAIAATFQDAGLSHALIQKKDCTDIDYDTMFVFSLIVALGFYALLFFAAPFIADFYRLPILKDIVRVTSLSLIITAFSSVQGIRMSKNLRFKGLSITSVIGTLLTGGISIAFAYNGWGVWALVFPGFIGSFYSLFVMWRLNRWWPRFRFSRESFRQLFGFGSKILCSGLINTIYHNLYSLVIGKAYTPADLGYFTRGSGYAAIPVGIIQGVAMRVVFPILAKMQDDNQRLLLAYRKLMRTPIFVLFPILMGMAVLAEPLVVFIIGEKWLPCVPFLQVFCFTGIFVPLSHINLNLLYVKGRSDLVLKLEVIIKPMGFFILIATVPFGLMVMAVGKALFDVLGFCINCYYTKKILDYGLWAQVRPLLPIFAHSGVMAVVVYLVASLISSPGLQLLVATPVGALVYLATTSLAKDESLVDVKELLREWLGKLKGFKLRRAE